MVNLLDRRSDLLVTQIQALRDALRQVRLHAPFRIDALGHPSRPYALPRGPYRQAMPTSPVAARDQDGILESFSRP
jgi:hypothetical protein